MASLDRSANFSCAAQRAIFAVTVSFAAAVGGLAATISFVADKFFPLFLQIFKRQITHEVGMMHYVGFGGTLDQVTFGSVRGDNMAHAVGHSTFHCQRHPSEGMAQKFPTFALPSLTADVFIFQ